MKYSIPSIDISPLVGRAASVQERESIASDVANALEHVGSFYVEGSGINGEMIEEWLNTVGLIAIRLGAMLTVVFSEQAGLQAPKDRQIHASSRHRLLRARLHRGRRRDVSWAAMA